MHFWPEDGARAEFVGQLGAGGGVWASELGFCALSAKRTIKRPKVVMMVGLFLAPGYRHAL